VLDTVTHIVRVIILRANSVWSRPKTVETQYGADCSLLSFTNQISYSMRKPTMKVSVHESKEISLIIYSVYGEFRNTSWSLLYKRPRSTKIVMQISSKILISDSGRVVLTRARIVISR